MIPPLLGRELGPFLVGDPAAERADLSLELAAFVGRIYPVRNFSCGRLRAHVSVYASVRTTAWGTHHSCLRQVDSIVVREGRRCSELSKMMISIRDGRSVCGVHKTEGSIGRQGA